MDQEVGSAPRATTQVVLLALAFVAMGFAAKGLPWLALSPVLGEDSILFPVVGAVLAAGFTWVGLRRFPHLRLPGVAFLPRNLGRDVLLTLCGLAAGLLLQGLAVGASIGCGGLTLTWRHPSSSALILTLCSGLAFAAANAAWEEYTIRGFPFSALGTVLGANGGVWATAFVFSALHLINPEWSASMLAETLLAGLLLGYAVLGGGTILFAIGLHAGWNTAESFFHSSLWWSTQGEVPSLVQMAVTGLGALVCFALVCARSSRRRGSEPRTEGFRE